MLMEDLKSRVCRYFTLEELALFLELHVEDIADRFEEELDSCREELLAEMGETDDNEPERLNWDD